MYIVMKSLDMQEQVVQYWDYDLEVFIMLFKYLVFNKDIFHAYLFGIIFYYYTKVNVKGSMIYVWKKNILIKLFINLRYISLYKFN